MGGFKEKHCSPVIESGIKTRPISDLEKIATVTIQVPILYQSTSYIVCAMSNASIRIPSVDRRSCGVNKFTFLVAESLPELIANIATLNYRLVEASVSGMMNQRVPHCIVD